MQRNEKPSAGDFKSAQRELRKHTDPAKAAFFPRFFKTGPGEYGEGDQFIGVTVPQIRGVAKGYRDLALGEVQKLLRSPVHEDRLLALLILVGQFQRGDVRSRGAIHAFYLKNLKWVNNWDLVDSSAPAIVGQFLLERGKRVPLKMARSPSLWERRVAILATLAFIRQGKMEETLRISKILLGDSEDLIHKAVGWMLREVGKRNLPMEKRFLDQYGPQMPRTMLRYAIEKFSPSVRKYYLTL